MKILFVFNHPAPYKVNLLNELSAYHQWDVIFERRKNSNRPKDFYYKECFLFNCFFIKGLPIGEENCFSFGIKNYIKKHHQEYDLIIMNGFSTFAEMFAIHYMIKHHIPYVLYINGGIPKKDSKLKYNLKKYFISNAFCYFSPSIKSDEYLLYYGANKETIFHYIYSTIYSNEVSSRKTNRKISKISDLHFVTFGQFIARKNNMQLLELSKKYNFPLTLIGSGQEEKKYKQFIKKYNLESLIVIKPFLRHNELLKELRNYDCFISLSRKDIYGHMINEVLSQGLPVICSNKIVSAHKLINKNTGVMVNINNSSEIENALNYLVKNFYNFNCQNIANQNTIEDMIASHLSILKELEK